MNFVMNLMVGKVATAPMINVNKTLQWCPVLLKLFCLDGKVTERGCSKRNRICEDMNPGMMYPMCKLSSYIQW